mmetsp:Transcript_6365/g.25479  ORF Transcript_6365/g.25479 Transcript_6365/m.25479 type:complete len:347 (+) Transcript_6365:3006-4046(+)
MDWGANKRRRRGAKTSIDTLHLQAPHAALHLLPLLLHCYFFSLVPNTSQANFFTRTSARTFPASNRRSESARISPPRRHPHTPVQSRRRNSARRKTVSKTVRARPSSSRGVAWKRTVRWTISPASPRRSTRNDPEAASPAPTSLSLGRKSPTPSSRRSPPPKSSRRRNPCARRRRIGLRLRRSSTPSTLKTSARNYATTPTNARQSTRRPRRTRAPTRATAVSRARTSIRNTSSPRLRTPRWAIDSSRVPARRKTPPYCRRRSNSTGLTFRTRARCTRSPARRPSARASSSRRLSQRTFCSPRNTFERSPARAARPRARRTRIRVERNRPTRTRPSNRARSRRARD